MIETILAAFVGGVFFGALIGAGITAKAMRRNGFSIVTETLPETLGEQRPII